MDELFIINPISGNGRKKKIERMLRSKGCRIAYTQYAGHAEILAAEASESVVVAVGGDGTVNEVARGALAGGKSLGIIPCGSGDGLALHLGISRNPRKALQTILAGRTVPLDCPVMTCGNERKRFFSVCGVGLDALVSWRFAQSHSRGLWTYVREAFRAWKGFQCEEYVIKVDGKELRRKAVLVTVANSNQWGNQARIAPHADSGDSLLDITVIHPFSSLQIPSLALRLMTGRIDGSRFAECLRGSSIRIERTSNGPAHFDGDCFHCGCTIDIEVGGEKLKVLAGPAT